MGDNMSEKKHVDPSALGLFGLAMVTLVASSQKLGITDGVAYVLPWAVFSWGVGSTHSRNAGLQKGERIRRHSFLCVWAVLVCNGNILVD